MARATIPTKQDIDDLASRAETDANARQELEALSRRLANRANERLRQLEKNDLDGTGAYSRAEYYIQEADFIKGSRFSKSKNLSTDDMQEQLTQISNFLRDKTSTPSGEFTRRMNILDSLAESERTDFDIDEIEELDKSGNWKKKFLRFLDSKAWEDVKKYFGTNTTFQEAGDALARGASTQSLINAFKAYARGENESDDILTIWDKWTSGKYKYQKGKGLVLKKQYT